MEEIYVGAWFMDAGNVGCGWDVDGERGIHGGELFLIGDRMFSFMKGIMGSK
jgi:hypothetical protein